MHQHAQTLHLFCNVSNPSLQNLLSNPLSTVKPEVVLEAGVLRMEDAPANLQRLVECIRERCTTNLQVLRAVSRYLQREGYRTRDFLLEEEIRSPPPQWLDPHHPPEYLREYAAATSNKRKR